MNRLPLYLIAATAALAITIWLVGAPGCNPDPPQVDVAREHAARADSAEAVADRYALRVDSLRRVAASQADSLLLLRERSRRALVVASEANAEAERLLNLYVNSGGSGTNSGTSSGSTSCAAALDACTIARRESAALASAQAVEIRALSDQVHRLSRIDSLRAGETLALRAALGEMQSAYEGMSEAYESERAARLSAKRRLWVERVVWGAVVVFAATR